MPTRITHHAVYGYEGKWFIHSDGSDRCLNVFGTDQETGKQARGGPKSPKPYAVRDGKNQ
ncbi:MAG TPA: hypothetical protein VGL38_14215 [bacterium]|jgi:hypothetical protein